MTSLKIVKACLAAVTLSCLPAVAGAVIIVVDPRDHALGADISNSYDGLTMSRLRQNESTGLGYDPVATPVIISDACSYGPSTSCLGGYWEINEWSWCTGATQMGIPSRFCSTEPWGVLELTFDVPTDLVQISASFGSDIPGMMLYDAVGNLISHCWGGGGCTSTYQPYESLPNGYRDNVMTLTFDSAVANVSRVIFAGVAGTVTANQIVYRYNVPEPGTLALLGLGLAGIGLARRRRTKLLTLQ